MISKETCVKIWNAWNEIEKSKTILEGLAEAIQKDRDKATPTLQNAFGEKQGLKLGVPSGDNSHQLYNVPFDLSIQVIEAHIKEQHRRLEELNAIAKVELYGANAGIK